MHALQCDVSALVQYISEHNLSKSLLISRRCNPVCSLAVEVNEQPLEKVNILVLQFPLIYHGAYTSPTSAPGLRDNWECSTAAFTVRQTQVYL